MRFSLVRLLVAMDDFGHKQPLTYKGSETFQTYVGAIISLAIEIFTLVTFVLYTKSMVLMEEPEVQNYTVPLTKQEIDETGDVNLAEEDFYVVIYHNINGMQKEIPPEVGRFYAFSEEAGFVDHVWTATKKPLEVKGCQDIIPAEHFEQNKKKGLLLDFLKFVDPADWNLNVFNDPIMGDSMFTKKVKFGFITCNAEESNLNWLPKQSFDQNVTCLSDQELLDW